MSKTERYHYKECGLDYIYLINGFTVETDEDGDEIIHIEGKSNLHRAIARSLINSKCSLSGMELRFLRSIMGVSQGCMAELLGMTRGRIAQLESKDEQESALSKVQQRLLRYVYANYMEEETILKHLIDLISEIEEKKVLREIDLAQREGDWSRVYGQAA